MRETWACKVDTWATSAPISAVAKVGSRRASTWPAWTTSPGFTSIERTMAVSSGWTTIVGERATTTPVAVTTRSTSITPARTHIAAIMLLKRQGEAAREPRHRHVDDGGGGRLILQDDRKGWVHPVLRRRY